MTRLDFVAQLQNLYNYIDADRVTEADDDALRAIDTLVLYATDEMTPEDFPQCLLPAEPEGETNK